MRMRVLSLLPVDAPIPAPSAELPPLRRAVGIRFAVGVVFAAGLVVAVDLPRQIAASSGSSMAELVAAVAGAALGLFLYRWVIGQGEQRDVTEVGTTGAVREGGIGFALGALMVAISIAVLALFGAYQFTSGSIEEGLGLLAVAISGAVGQELAIRGLIYRILEETFGTWLTLLLTAILFGWLHLASPEGTALGAVAVAVEGAALLGAAYVLTRRLWLAIGIHLGWSLTLTAVFGGRGDPGLLTSQGTGPAWITGGTGGAEVSVVAIALSALVAAGLLVWANQAGRIRAPRWRRPTAEAF